MYKRKFIMYGNAMNPYEKYQNIVFFGLPAYGHINPTLSLINELVRCNYRVIYYATEEYRTEIEGHGAEFRAYNFQNVEWNPQIGSQILKLAELILRFSNEQLETLLAQVKELQPILIMHDTLAFWGRVVADAMGIKAASVNAIITTHQYTSKTFWLYTTHFIGKLLFEYGAIRNIIKYQNKIYKRYPIKNHKVLGLLMNEERLNIYTYPRLIHPDADKLKNNCFFLGPAVIHRNDLYQGEEEYKYDNLIYVSLGTIFNDNIKFYKTIFSAFANTKYVVVISCGNSYDKLIKENLPGNIILKSYVNQKKIFKNAILFITAGGMNSICEAVSNRVPCLCYPQQGEQAINAKYLKKLGLGDILKKECELMKAAENLLEHYCPEPELIREFSTVYMNELIERLMIYISEKEN